MPVTVGLFAFALMLGLAGCTSSSGEGNGGEGGSGGTARGICQTDWEPAGCRGVYSNDAAIASRVAFRNLHGDPTNSDEVSVALAPEFEVSWTEEDEMVYVTGPTFGSDGTVYLTPLMPYEDVLLVALDPSDGSRKWSVPSTTNSLVGGAAAMVLADPDNPGGELIYVGVYERVVAVRANGSTVWDVQTGLTSVPDQDSGLPPAMFGLNYLPQFDAIVGLTEDGQIFIVDRKTGASRLQPPFSLPGEKSPAIPSPLPPAALDAFREAVRAYIDAPKDADPAAILDVLRGNNVEVANFFSIDPNTGTLWVAATAPDDEDGTADGVSELGALYRLDVAAAGNNLSVSEVCHRSFIGGSASTPALNPEGTRVYVGDNEGKLIAIDRECNDLWEVDLEGQILGSVAVSSDNDELYASTATAAHQVFDRGTTGERGWSSLPDVFTPMEGEENLNMNLVGIAANGLGIQVGVGNLFNDQSFTRDVGVGLLDRNTGRLRYFKQGLDETVSVIAIGPGGEIFIGNSPVRRMLHTILAPTFGWTAGAPVTGGITKFGRIRSDKLVVDASCAASDRAANAALNQTTCADSVAADVEQIEQLIAQARGAAAEAAEAGDLRSAAAVRTALDEAEAALQVDPPELALAAERLLDAAEAASADD